MTIVDFADRHFTGIFILVALLILSIPSVTYVRRSGDDS